MSNEIVKLYDEKTGHLIVQLGDEKGSANSGFLSGRIIGTDHLELETIWVNPVYGRKRGLGTELLEQAVEFASDKGVEKIAGLCAIDSGGLSEKLPAWYRKRGIQVDKHNRLGGSLSDILSAIRLLVR